MKKTKIVATIGPSCDSLEKIEALVHAGVNVFRFNLKHNSQEWHSERILRVEKVQSKLGVALGILLDLQGPEIRIGTFEEGSIELKTGDQVTFALSRNIGEKTILLDNLKLLKSLSVGSHILIDDGYFRFKVIEQKEDSLIAETIKGGKLNSRKGMNIPQLSIDLPVLVEKDLSHLDMAAKYEVDFIALSFCRSAEDVAALRRELQKRKLNAAIISKIENQKAVDNFDEILEVSDGIMVARGDLGIELEYYQLPVLQKQIIEKSRLKGKPVITATQMLQSMIQSPIPTRAEVSDVANAVYDATDAVMLSGETATGSFPIEAVTVQAKTAEYVEKHRHHHSLSADIQKTTDAVVSGAYNLYQSLRATKVAVSAFIVLTETGYTVRMLSRFRPTIPIIAIARSKSIQDQLSLSFGVIPLALPIPSNDPHPLTQIYKELASHKLLQKGQLAIVVYGKTWGTPGHTTTISLEEVHL